MTVGGLHSSPAGAATVGSDRADIAKLEAQIAQQGEHAQSLVSRYNAVQGHLNDLNAQIEHDQRRVAADQGVEADAMVKLRTVAVKAYVSAGGVGLAPLAMLDGTSNITSTFENNQYLGAVNAKMNATLDALQLDEANTHDSQQAVQAEQKQVDSTLRDLASSRDAATAAVAAGEAELTRVNGNLRALLAAANAEHQEEQEAAERALARSEASHAAPTPAPDDPADATPPVPVTAPPSAPTTTPPPVSSSGGYANPLRDIAALTPERIDQGVDYAGFGPIYAIGDGVVLNTVGNGWPGGTFIAYQLTSGPASGLVVFAAEDIEPSVQVGATVNSGTVLGQMYAGPDGIETGWANGSRLPDTMARTYGQFNGSNSTAFGYNFSQLLQALGAPGGILDGAPNGSLPASWPRW